MLALPCEKICVILQTSMQKNKQSRCLRVKCRVYGELIAGRKPLGYGAGIASRCCRHGRRSKTFLVAATLRHIGTRRYAYHNGKEGLFSCPDSPSSPSSTPVSPWPWRYSSPMSLPSRRSSCASPSAFCQSPSTARCTARYDKSVNIYFILYKFTL